jgi:hypothetical protein
MTITDHIIAKYNRTHTAKQLAVELGSTSERLRALAHKLRKRGIDIPTRTKPVGIIVTHNDGKGTRRMKMPDGSWKYVPNGRPRFGGIKERKASTVNRDEKVSKTGSQVAKNRFIPNSERPPIEKKTTFRTDRNPESCQIRKDTGTWIRIDSRTWKLKKNAA